MYKEQKKNEKKNQPFFIAGSQNLEKVAPRGCTVAIFGAAQNTTGHGPEQTAPACHSFEQGGWMR